jgi:hypothetical protein
VVIVVESTTLDKVRQVLEDSELSAVTEEVVGYLRFVEGSDQRLDALAGRPLLLDTAMRAETYAGQFHRQVFDEVPMVNAKWVADLLGPVSDVRGFMRRLRASSDIVALKHGNTFVYPAFQFSAERREVKPAVAEANRLLRSATDPWGALAWWTAPNPRWGRRRPIEHADDRRLVALAGAEPDDGF